MPFKAYIKGNSAIDSSALIVVTESTWSGNKGVPDTFLISKIYCYVPFSLSQLLGSGQFTTRRPGYATFVTTFDCFDGRFNNCR